MYVAESYFRFLYGKIRLQVAGGGGNDAGTAEE